MGAWRIQLTILVKMLYSRKVDNMLVLVLPSTKSLITTLDIKKDECPMRNRRGTTFFKDMLERSMANSLETAYGATGLKKSKGFTSKLNQRIYTRPSRMHPHLLLIIFIIICQTHRGRFSHSLVTLVYKAEAYYQRVLQIFLRRITR